MLWMLLLIHPIWRCQPIFALLDLLIFGLSIITISESMDHPPLYILVISNFILSILLLLLHLITIFFSIKSFFISFRQVHSEFSSYQDFFLTTWAPRFSKWRQLKAIFLHSPINRQREFEQLPPPHHNSCHL